MEPRSGCTACGRLAAHRGPGARPGGWPRTIVRRCCSSAFAHPRFWYAPSAPARGRAPGAEQMRFHRGPSEDPRRRQRADPRMSDVLAMCTSEVLD